jgi:hypothetical protein
MDFQYICEPCNYKCSKKSNITKHYLTKKHELINQNAQKVTTSFQCDICKFICNKQSNYNKHLNTQKHLSNEINVIDKTACECGKKYKNSRTLYFHKKKCDFKKPSVFFNVKDIEIDQNHIINNDTISCIMSEIKMLMVEQTKMNKIITDIANKPTNANSITNNNQTNNQFNLNMFLNETCKDAMNLSEFLENMHVSMEDMEKTGELGFAKGMSRIIMNNLNAIDVCKRPIHCSDVKRETLYVKNNGVWEKETEDRKRTKEIIYKASRLNLKELLKWRDLPRNKGYDKSDHTKNDEFTNLVMEINKMREEEFDKIITSVSKHVAIDKEKVKMSGYLN